MKLALIVAVTCFLQLTAQETAPSQLQYLSVPTTASIRPLSVAALQIERGLGHPSIVRLKGTVEIKTPVCVAIGTGNAQRCSGYVVVRADEADPDENSGQLNARGNVKLTREL